MNQRIVLNEQKFKKLLKSGNVYAIVNGTLKGIVNIIPENKRKTNREIQSKLYEQLQFRPASTYALAESINTNIKTAKKHLEILLKDKLVEKFTNEVIKQSKCSTHVNFECSCILPEYSETHTYWRIKS